MAYFTRFRKAATPAATVGASVEVSEMEALAKGTMIIGDGSGAPTSLAVGDDDQVLTADAGEGSGVKWAAAAGGASARSDLTQDDLASYPIPLSAFRKKARLDVSLDSSPSAPDLGTIDNTFGTAAPTLETESQQTNGGEAIHNARFQFPVPIEYVNGQTVTIRVNAGMRGGTADTHANLDVVCVRTAAANTDICATAAQSINNTTAANKDFTITPTNVVSGDILDVVISTLIEDMSSSSGIYGQIKSVEVLLDVKG